jgi:hypothetical protein
MFCRSCLSFFLWPLHCLCFIDLRVVITPFPACSKRSMGCYIIFMFLNKLLSFCCKKRNQSGKDVNHMPIRYQSSGKKDICDRLGTDPFANTGVKPRFLMGFVLVIVLVWCVVIYCVSLRPVSFVPSVARKLRFTWYFPIIWKY